MNERLNRPVAREIATAPIFQGEPRHVCPLYPDCECSSDCTAGAQRRRAIAIAKCLAVAAVAIAAGLIIWSMFHG
jgi:hypothetical protein